MISFRYAYSSSDNDECFSYIIFVHDEEAGPFNWIGRDETRNAIIFLPKTARLKTF